MKETEIKTLEQLVDFINERDEWPLVVDDIINKNGWNNLTWTEYDICSDGGEVATFDESGKAVVIK